MLKDRRLELCLLFLILLVYCLFPTRNHYWDGIGFALAIEESHGLTYALFNPNHLFYNFFGYSIYHSVRWLLPELRALSMLSALSIGLSVGSAYLLFSMLMRSVGDRYISVWLTLLFAFSATWWKFSTDANVYVPSVFFLLLAACKLQTQPKPNWVSIGMIHAVSMLLHQIAVFFFPVVVVVIFCDPLRRGLKAAWRNALVYTSVASGIVILAYCWVWFRVFRWTNVRALVSWVLSNGREEFAFVSVVRSIWETLRSTVRIFFGGRFSLALTHVEVPFLVILAILLVCSISLLSFTVWDAFKRSATLWKFPAWDRSRDGMIPVLLTWIGSFAAFLSLWLTGYPYYRLFYLPALILLLGLLLKRHWNSFTGEHSFVLASFVVVMILINFTFLIYPYSKTEATPPVHLAIKANEIWHDDVIYFSNFNCDNWIFRYFNKGTTWRPVTLKDLQALTDELKYLKSQGRKTWIDATALDQISESEELSEWFARRIQPLQSYGLADRKHRIQFSLITPRLSLETNPANVNLRQPDSQ
ncbi:MAG: hypothetical protein L0387_00130 [Acidobacteria bacterium]|nr:hypothetical protein [Acidobacteriota bacterium]